MLGQRRAAQIHPGLVGALRVVMHRPRDQFLAGSAFARNQHRGVGARHALRHRQQAPHGLAGDDRRHAQKHVQFRYFEVLRTSAMYLPIIAWRHGTKPSVKHLRPLLKRPPPHGQFVAETMGESAILSRWRMGAIASKSLIKKAPAHWRLDVPSLWTRSMSVSTESDQADEPLYPELPARRSYTSARWRRWA